MVAYPIEKGDRVIRINTFKGNGKTKEYNIDT